MICDMPITAHDDAGEVVVSLPSGRELFRLLPLEADEFIAALRDATLKARGK